MCFVRACGVGGYYGEVVRERRRLSRRALLSALLALLDDFVHVCDRADFDGAKTILEAGKLGDELNGVIEISGLKNLKAA